MVTCPFYNFCVFSNFTFSFLVVSLVVNRHVMRLQRYSNHQPYHIFFRDSYGTVSIRWTLHIIILLLFTHHMKFGVVIKLPVVEFALATPAFHVDALHTQNAIILKQNSHAACVEAAKLHRQCALKKKEYWIFRSLNKKHTQNQNLNLLLRRAVASSLKIWVRVRHDFHSYGRRSVDAVIICRQASKMKFWVLSLVAGLLWKMRFHRR